MVDSILDLTRPGDPIPGSARRVWPDVASSTDDYAARFSGRVGAHFLSVQLDGVVEGLGVRGNGLPSVLDVGGGHAQLAGPLIARGHAVTVLGSDERCSDRLRQRLDRRAYTFVTGPLHPTPFSDSAFDCVVAVRMLAHMDDHRGFIGELCRVAARRVVVDFPVRRMWDSLGGLGFALKKGVEGNTRHFRTYSESEISTAFSAHGFSVHSAVRQFALPMALHRTVGNVRVTKVGEWLARKAGMTRLVGSPVLLVAERRGES